MHNHWIITRADRFGVFPTQQAQVPSDIRGFVASQATHYVDADIRRLDVVEDDRLVFVTLDYVPLMGPHVEPN